MLRSLYFLAFCLFCNINKTVEFHKIKFTKFMTSLCSFLLQNVKDPVMRARTRLTVAIPTFAAQPAHLTMLATSLIL